MSERASLKELLEFANKVREAGGGNPIDALMPAVPEDSSQCLIAKNLNFNCKVDGFVGNGYSWAMWLKDEATRDKISESLDLEKCSTSPEFEYGVVLPPEISQIAKDFDDAGKTIFWILGDESILSEINDDEFDSIKEFAPYVELATEEAHKLATFVNKDGSIVL